MRIGGMLGVASQKREKSGTDNYSFESACSRLESVVTFTKAASIVGTGFKLTFESLHQVLGMLPTSHLSFAVIPSLALVVCQMTWTWEEQEVCLIMNYHDLGMAIYQSNKTSESKVQTERPLRKTLFRGTHLRVALTS